MRHLVVLTWLCVMLCFMAVCHGCVSWLCVCLQVETIGERIVLYVLNRVVYRAKEISSGELPFLCHGENHYAKILWKDGQAVGFYSVKPSGTKQLLLL